MACLLAAGFAQSLATIPGTGISIWPASGVLLGGMLCTPRKSWVWWIGAASLAELTGNAVWFHNTLPVALAFCLGNGLEAVFGAWLIQRLRGSTFRLDTTWDVLALVVLGAGAAPVIAATIGSAALAWSKGETLLTAWPLLWVGDGAGALIVAPLTICILRSREEFARLSTQRTIEAVILACVFVGVGLLSLSGFLPFAYIVMPALLWAAVRFELPGAILTSLALTLMAAAFTVSGASPFATAPWSNMALHVMLQLFLAISALSALLVAVISKQRRQALQNLKKTNEELEARVAERTASLSQSEAQNRQLFDQSIDGIFITDEDARILDVSPAGCQLLGSEKASIVGRYFFEFLRPDELERYTAARRKEGHMRRDEWRFRRSDGAAFIGELAGQRLPDGRSLKVLNDVTERIRAQEQLQLLMQEVNHRAKNMLSVVQAVARQTVKTSPEDFLARFDQRIQSLSASQDLLVRSEWRGVRMKDLVLSQLAHFKDLAGVRIFIEGPDVKLTALSAQAIGMALHELATNAGKYGALSNEEGRVDINWAVHDAADGASNFIMEWIECGGPRVERPDRRGFGSTVIEKMTRRSLLANVELGFDPEGLKWRLESPIERILDMNDPRAAITMDLENPLSGMSEF